MNPRPRHLAEPTPRTIVMEHVQEILSKHWGAPGGTGRRRGAVK